MRSRSTAIIIGAALAAAGCVGSALALGQSFSAAERLPLEGIEWPMERVTLRDGRQYQGLIESEKDDWLDFMEIQRPPGRPMYLVLRPIQRASIVRIQRLDAADRARAECAAQGLPETVSDPAAIARVAGVCRQSESLPLSDARDRLSAEVSRGRSTPAA